MSGLSPVAYAVEPSAINILRGTGTLRTPSNRDGLFARSFLFAHYPRLREGMFFEMRLREWKPQARLQ